MSYPRRQFNFIDGTITEIKFDSRRDYCTKCKIKKSESVTAVSHGEFVTIILKIFIFDFKEPLDLDDLLPVLGEFGLYQKLLLWFICLPACIPCGFCAFNQLFMADAPDDYWCNVPELSDFNLTDEQIRSVAIPSVTVSFIFY